MAKKDPALASGRLKTLQLSQAQIEEIASPVREVLIGAFQSYGPISVSDMAQVLGRDPKVLYYQVRRLLAAGLIRSVGKRQAGRKEESLYDAVADRYTLDSNLDDPDYRNSAARAGAAMLQNTARAFEKAMTSPVEPQIVPDGGRLIRMHVRLQPEDVAEFLRRIRELAEFAALRDSRSNPHQIEWCSVLVQGQ